MISHAEQFHELNQTRQHETRGQQLDLFQPVTSLNKTSEFWFFSDLHNLFGEKAFPTTQAKEKTAHEKIIYPYSAKPTIQQQFDFCTGHYDRINHQFKQDYINFQNALDLKLTRYACWSFLKHDPRTVFAQTYFISPVIKPDMDFDTLNPIAAEYQRINPRKDVSSAESKLAGILKAYHANYKDFYNSTSLALFNGQTYHDIKDMHRIPHKDGDTLLNYMGRYTLHARITAIYRAINRFNAETNKTIIRLDEILCDELYNQRVEMINQTGMRPEQNISIRHIKQIEKHKNNTEQEFIKKYAHQVIR